ncbi:hypothetical protein [Halorussus salinus]|uniref:hypothetical protein n=1 Tax=Halorussus salinus TaxID=1364935 RepID=UPI00109281FD|nr:hypothetical protein [Halorussus salinus]
MAADADEIRDRLQLVELDESLSVTGEELTYAEDPETGCLGIGEIEAEAVGNAISVVVRYEREGDDGPPLVKAPGNVVRKTWGGDRRGAFERLGGLV